MQNIDLIAIGKMNAAYFAQGVAEYQKRLGGFCNFRIIELPEVQIADKNASDRQIAKALQKEGEAILASVRRGAYLVALCVEGKQVSSEDLAAMIADRAMSGAGLFNAPPAYASLPNKEVNSLRMQVSVIISCLVSTSEI